ncbi:uncharacterized protein LOC125039080 [Penaeus chinensis]|uniref:uncharacterized protein LOC125039080 n=1 Tax=Penaeus chinensis TaxID=139456 RepID=UPI001FB72122|nr:uncharacterized protein LOC125039080 [Penaeus chinensis]
MKPRLQLLVGFTLSLLTVGSTQECTGHQLRGVRIQLASGPRTITVSLEENQKLDVSFRDKNKKSFTNAGSHTINIKEKDSKYCLDSPTLPFEEACAHAGDTLFLLSNRTTTWTLGCPPDSGGRTASCPDEPPPLRLQAVLLGLDSGVFAFKWRPNHADTRILLRWESFGTHYGGSDWNDFLVSRGVNGRPCRVYSEALNVNVSCDATKDYMTFGSFTGGFAEVANDFAFPCEDLQQDSAASDRPERDPGAPGTPSPGGVPPKPTLWNVLEIVGAGALVVIAVVLVPCVVASVVKRVRKSKSSREAAITADDLHDPGRDDDRKDDHDYCYIDMAVLNSELEEERRATRTDHGGETTSLRSHDSENSLYGTGLAEGRA